MKIGEFFVKNNYIVQDELNRALYLQKRGVEQRLGGILVMINAITKKKLSKYVSKYEKVNKVNV